MVNLIGKGEKMIEARKNPQERNLSRIYVRIKRDGKYQSVDLADMTPEELEEFLNKEDLTIEYFRRLTKNLIEVDEEE